MTTHGRHPASLSADALRFCALVLGTSVALAPPALAQPAPSTAPAYTLLPHSDSQFAHELLRLGQLTPMKAELASAKGTPAENLWNAELLLAGWGTDATVKSNRSAAEAAYMQALTAYLDSQTAGIDGVWALDHAKFIFATLSEPLINRMEYWSSNAKDRAALAPMAALADRLLKQSSLSLAAGMHQAESQTPFDEAAYMRNFNATVEVEYYGAWSHYFLAMAMAPQDPARRGLLLGAAGTLGKWADDKEDNGVNNQSLLLRGKILSEAGEYDKAAADLTRAAQNTAAPAWVQYQARYQLVVARLRAGTFAAANAELDFFRKSLPQNNTDAQMSTNMLAFRVAWAEALTKQGDDKHRAQVAALEILSDIIRRDPRFRTLVYEELAAQIPENAAPTDLLPMQQLALAYTRSQGQTGATPKSREELKGAAAAAVAVHDNPAISTSDKVEATFLAGVCNALLNNLQEAARYNIEFAELAPADPRAKQLLDLALQQIGELRKLPNAQKNPDLLHLQERALALATNGFSDARWRYAQARTYEDSGKLAEAAQAFSKIPRDDKNYLDAQYHLVSIATSRFSSLTAKSPEADVRAAAADLFAACSSFVQLLDNPPPTIDKDALERAKAYRTDIWLIEASTALNPVVKQPDLALDRLTKLEGVKDQLSAAQQAAVLRYRIQAYQLAGQPDKALQVVQDYAKSHGQDATALIHNMAFSTLQEITQTEKSDPQKARGLAEYAVKLLEPLIADGQHNEAQKDAVYGYRQLQADMMVRAGQYQQAQGLANALIKEKPEDLLNNMIEARAIFERARATADAKAYAEAQDYFGRILPKVTNAGESYWECWLRILQCKEAIGGPDAVDSITKRLNDLRAAFGSAVGGEVYKDDFARLVQKYAP